MNIKQMIEKKRGHIEAKISKIYDLVASVESQLEDERVTDFISDSSFKNLSDASEKINKIMSFQKVSNEANS